MSRIGMIREVISRFGGHSNFRYYADGPQSNFGPSGGKGNWRKDRRVSYKIERRTDGLNEVSRADVLPVLARIPGVERVYLTRPHNVSWGVKSSGGCIKIIFADKAKNMNDREMNLPVDFFTQMKDNAPTVNKQEADMTSVPESVKIKHFVQMFGNEDAAATLAKFFAESMAESSAIMCEDDPSVEVPDATALKAMTVDYAKDMVSDFETTLMDAIDKLFNEAKIVTEAKREVKISITL